MTVGSTPAGWYPDPWQGGAMRWWDGASWTGYAAGAGAGVTPRLDDEARMADRVRLALLVVIPLGILGQVGTIFYWRRLSDDFGDDMFGSTPDLGSLALGQLNGLVTMAVGVLFLMWFFRSTENARALGLVGRRDAGLATAGFIIPVVNFWWPYQSTCDVLPPGHPARSRVLRWWLLWMVGGMVAALGLGIAAFVGGGVEWAFLVLAAIQITAAALAARQVVGDVVDAHWSLANAAATTVR